MGRGLDCVIEKVRVTSRCTCCLHSDEVDAEGGGEGSDSTALATTSTGRCSRWIRALNLSIAAAVTG